MSLTFGGSSSTAVDCGSGASLDDLPNGANGMTALAWIRRTSDGNSQYFAEKAPSYVAGWGMACINTAAEGQLYFTVFDSGPQAEAVPNTTSSNLVGLNTWKCVGATFLKTTAPKLYIGDLTTTIAEVSGYNLSTAGPSSPATDASSNLYIGNIVYPSASAPFKGAVGVFALFNRVLSVGEMQAWQHDPKMMSGCVGLWNLGDNGTGTQPDFSGNGNAGTVSGATQSDNPPLRRRWGRRLLQPSRPAVVSYTLTASSGAFTETGTAATLRVARKLTAASGTFTETGTAATLKVGYKVAAGSGTFTETGTAAGLKVGRVVTAASGTFTETGTAAALKVARRITAASGTFTETGTDATLTYSGTPARTLTASSGSFTETGTAATLRVGRVVTASSGTYTETGTAATLRWAHKLAAATDSFAVTGTAATLRCGRVVGATSGTFTESGTAAALRCGRRITADVGAFVWTGSDATLRYSAAIIVSSAFLVAHRSGTRYQIEAASGPRYPVTDRSEPRYRSTRRE